MDLKQTDLLKKELKFRTSRSSGPGGQSVNKLSTKVELLFDINESQLLNDEQKSLINERLANRINNNGLLILSSGETRSQLKNKEIVIQRFLDLIKEALKPVKIRKPTKVPVKVKEKRLKTKKFVSDKKGLRKPPEY
ncbi:MAG: aminoacyl-tRNA hydrolase [Chlorobi bacterium]|nr:aminoacyl-tRNA hydrolase [Chlorobiota bacterium]